MTMPPPLTDMATGKPVLEKCVSFSSDVPDTIWNRKGISSHLTGFCFDYDSPVELDFKFSDEYWNNRDDIVIDPTREMLKLFRGNVTMRIDLGEGPIVEIVTYEKKNISMTASCNVLSVHVEVAYRHIEKKERDK
jgi:hypothetical protein